MTYPDTHVETITLPRVGSQWIHTETRGWIRTVTAVASDSVTWLSSSTRPAAWRDDEPYVGSVTEFLRGFEPYVAPPEPPMVEHITVFEPWPFEEDYIRTTLRRIGRDGELSEYTGGWYLQRELDPYIVALEDGERVVASKDGLPIYLEKVGQGAMLP